MIRRTLLVLGLMLGLPASPSGSLEAWVHRLEARSVKASAGLWDVETGKLVEGHQMDLSLVPASVTKVASTYAMLKVWKPDYVIRTEVWGSLRGGTVTGDLIFKGAGDPTLVGERLWLLAERLKAAGVKSVTGRVRTDQSAFDSQEYGNGWESTSSDTTPPILPLSVNWNRDGGRLVRDPDRFAMETLTGVLRQDGITIAGGAADGAAPHLITTFESWPLRDMIEAINKHSNNFMVEMLVKRFGAGTWPQGIAQIQHFYEAMMNLGPGRINITDGSGLSKDNRLSAATLATILRVAWHDFEVGPELVSSLKIIGGEPFKLRFQDPDLERRIRCKTGHLNNVNSVCGYIQGIHGERFVFAIILNGNATMDDAWDQVKTWAMR